MEPERKAIRTVRQKTIVSVLGENTGVTVG